MKTIMSRDDAFDMECGDRWIEFARRLGWRVHGWSYDDRATLLTDPHETLQITKAQMQDIEKAILTGGVIHEKTRQTP